MLARLAIRVSTVAFAFLQTMDRSASAAPAIMKALIVKKVSKKKLLISEFFCLNF